jgi:hypothetical protein
MTLKQTLWRLDTCECVIIIEVDDSDVNSTVIFKRMDKICSDHINTARQVGNRILYSKLMEENQRKNRVRSAFITELNQVASETISRSGTVQRELKPNVEFNYTFTGNPLTEGGRDIEVELTDAVTKDAIPISNSDVLRVQNRIDNLGVDRRRVVIRRG